MWQLVLASGAIGALVSLYNLYRYYKAESKLHNESQTLAKWSVLFGLSGIVLMFIGSAIGLLLGLIALPGRKYTALAKIGIVLSILTAIPWVMVLVLGG